MQIHELKIRKRKSAKRIGRGGKKGTYAGRGMNGQKSRSGASINPIFEGGRSTLIEHLPKMRGFKSHRPKNQVVDIEKLQKHFNDGDTVNPAALHRHGLVRKTDFPVKILGKGDVSKKIMIENCFASKNVKKTIEKAGGKIVSGS